MEETLEYRENNIKNRGQRHNKERKPKKSHGKLLLFVVVLMSIGFAVLMSPVFTIKKVVVSGNLNKFTEQEVKDLLEINEGNNLFTISKSSAIKKMKSSPYIESITIKKEYPSTICVDVLERRVRGYVPYMSSYLYIDEYGRVLDIKTSFTEPLPVVNGLKFDSFHIGEKIETQNPEAFEVMVVIAQIMTKYEMLDTVVNLDVSDTENISARVNKVDVNLGSVSNCDEKIRTMAEIIKQIPKEDMGTLDLSDLSKPFIFKYLT